MALESLSFFSAGPPAGEIWYVDFVFFGIEDSGTLDIEDFGALPALANGWLFDQFIDASSETLANFQTNFAMGTVGTTGGGIIGVGAGFLNTANAFGGNIRTDPEVTLVGDNSDLIRTTVRDNLTGLNFLRAAMSYWKEI